MRRLPLPGGSIRSHQALGRPAEAIAVYRRGQRLFATTVGRLPSPTTADLYRSMGAS